MAKFHGNIGFGSAEPMETEPGIWSEEGQLVEKEHSGELLRVTASIERDETNPNRTFKVTNRVSVIASPFTYENLSNIKYVVYEGVKWTVERVNIQHPRIILTLGEVYKGA